MHDALAYRRDTEVVDVDGLDEPQPRIARSRVPTGELNVHVQLDDGWHRMDPDGLSTACDQYIDVRLQLGTRNERQLEQPLAPCECWTAKEHRKANEAYRKKWGRDFKP